MRLLPTFRAVLALAVVAATGVARGDASSRFAQIDTHALAAPRSSTGSVQSLAAHFGHTATSDQDKARAAFCWIAHNIVYDSSLRGSETSGDRVLAQRRAVCVGYARLFQALAEEMDLEAQIIWGHGKGRGYEVGAAPTDDQDHAWNVVRIDGTWSLVDCTWGAGWVDEHGQFVRSYRPHYFLTPPEHFVYDHFPSDPRWQLLDDPISEADYISQVQLKPSFFECGLRLVSHQTARIQASETLSVTIEVPRAMIVSPSLFRDEREVDQRYTFAQRAGDRYVIHAALPSKGTYILRIFAGPKSAGGHLEWVLDYAVEASSGTRSRDGFPKTYGAFLMHDCRVDRPLSRVIRAGSSVEFSLTAPGADDVMVANAGVQQHLAAGSARFSGVMRVHTGEVIIFARFPGSSRYQALLEYHAR
jgi:transglutaminase/protease-like cytokinesis protein 3